VKLWPFVVVLVGLVVAGTVHILVREPAHDASTRAGRELPRLPVDRITSPLPPRFSGPLPSKVEGFQQALEQGPPLSYVRARLLEGDREMGAKFLTALRQVAASARSFDELWAAYGVVLGTGDHERNRFGPPEDTLFYDMFQDEGVPCAWLRERLSDAPEESPLLTELLWRKLVRCPGPETTALFAREDAPAQWVLDHRTLFDSASFTPAHARAIRRLLEQGRRELFFGAWNMLEGDQQPVAQELREELWRRASDEQRAEWEQIETNLAAMRRQQEAHPWKCPSIPTRPEGVDELTVQRCLEEWVTTNWAATARFAMSASRSPELQDGSVALATVRNFPSVAVMKAWARERDLLPEGAPALEEGPDKLYLRTRMLPYPRRHDDLLVTLAWKVRPELAGVVFEQLSPKVAEPQLFEPRPSEGYTLRAYADGQRYSVPARNSHSLVDMGAVVGLLNQVLEARGSPRRFAMLDSRVSQVHVVFGPEAALQEADARELWRLGDGNEVFEKAEASLEGSLRIILGKDPF
jgi:hypothetical protein